MRDQRAEPLVIVLSAFVQEIAFPHRDIRCANPTRRRARCALRQRADLFVPRRSGVAVVRRYDLAVIVLTNSPTSFRVVG